MRGRLIAGGSREDRQEAIRDILGGLPGTIVELEPRWLPFRRPETVALPAPPRLILIKDAELAFPNWQTTGTRLVLTQSTYLIQKWLDRLGEEDSVVVAGDGEALEQGAPEALRSHGPWRFFEVVDLEQPVSQYSSITSEVGEDLESTLAKAYSSTSAPERLRLCRQAVARHAGSAVAHLALASACREVQELDEARRCLEEAARLAPDWEAVHFETGKFWLGAEDMERASAGFRRAADLMPSFAAAFGNLGATLGELNRPDEAYAAFCKALEADPDNITILNNIGVVCREVGKLDESVAALRRVVADAPEFVFGHYNLGHSLLLAGDPAAALAAYEEGQERDPQKNRRQGCRMAVVRFANGDVDGAQRDLLRFAGEAPPEEREDLLLEAYEIAQALLVATPALEVHRRFLDRIADRLRGVY